MATSADRLTEFETAQKRYQDLVGGQGAFKSLVEQKLGEKTNYNKDLITQQQNLQERNLSLPTELQQEWSNGVIRDPFAQRALIESRQSNIGAQLGATNALLSARGQDQSKILDIANNNYQSQLSGQGVAADAAYKLYQDALSEEASRRSAAAQSSSNAIMDAYYKSLMGGGDTTVAQPELDITVDEAPTTNWSDLVTEDTGKTIQNNPVTTVAGLIGNLIGNKNNKNLTFWQKLLNKR